MSLSNMVLSHVQDNDIDQTCLWPYNFDDEDAPKLLDTPIGPWSLYMDAGGSTYLWPTRDRNPHGGLLVWRGEKEDLEKFFVFTSSGQGYWDNHPYKYQSDARRFNWPTGTLAGLYTARLVAKALLSGENNKAWDLGRALEDRVNRAMDPEYWAARDAASEAGSSTHA